MDMNPFAKNIMEQKYSHTKKDGEIENWEDISKRVAKHVMKSVGAPLKFGKEVERIIAEKKFMPGGRYLYASGRPFHQVQNCLLLRAEDSREGWADIAQKATMALMTGAGIGIVYTDLRAEGSLIRKTGGFATGPLALMQMVNELGRGIMQGGSRRSAIWAGLHWYHADIMKFIRMKDWSFEVRRMKEEDYNFPATLDGTNISVILDDEFFKAYENDKHEKHALAKAVYWAVVEQMLKTAEPGFSVDVGVNAGENLRNAPVSGETSVLLKDGYAKVKDILNEEIEIWTGKQFAKTIFKKTKEDTKTIKVLLTGGREITCDPEHEFITEDNKRIKAEDLIIGTAMKVSPIDISNSEFDSTYYSLGYIYGDGSFNRKYARAEVTFCTNESRQCIEYFNPDLLTSVKNESRGYLRAYTKNNALFEKRSKSIFPQDVFSATVDQQVSFLAGLFDADGNYSEKQNRIRVSSVHKEFLVDTRRLLEQLGIFGGISTAGISSFGNSQGYSISIQSSSIDKFKKLIPVKRLKINNHSSYRVSKIKVIDIIDDINQDVYCCDVGVPEHSFMAEGIIISNCTEITSRDDSDICNLGSINMANITSLEDMKNVVELATAFLLAGTVYSDVPYAKVDQVRTKNRRLGLGLMGLHEWLLKNGHRYDKNEELQKYLEVYKESDAYAAKYAKEWNLTVPIKTRAIAPTGTIGIVAETTTGIEPIFCVAYKRRYLKGSVVHYQYVVDPTAKRLIESGINPDNIEDAYSLADDVERRVAFQAWVQEYVDHSISSTINLPEWGSELNNSKTVQPFGNMLMKYLPKLRGITCYPDGARGGQPFTPVKYTTAMKHIGEVFVEQADVCDITKAGSCG